MRVVREEPKNQRQFPIGFELANIAASQTFPNNKDGSFNFLTDTSSLPNTASQ